MNLDEKEDTTMFDGIFGKQNLAAAGAATLGVMLALNLTAKQSKLVQGGIAFGAACVALKLASKI